MCDYFKTYFLEMLSRYSFSKAYFFTEFFNHWFISNCSVFKNV